jgi:DNA-directed RNA polymerase specialized sigma24 family protein
VLLRDVEGLSSAEMCAVLGIHDGHGRVLLHRGRAGVRRLLDAEMTGSR